VQFAVWPVRLRALLNNDQGIFHCPQQDSEFEWRPQSGTGAGFATAADAGWGYNVGEKLMERNTFPFSYGYNDWGASLTQPATAPNTQRGLGGDLWNPNSRELKASRVRRPAEMIAIADNTPDRNWDFNIEPHNQAEALGNIHNGGANILFCDGHVQWYPQQDFMLYDIRNPTIRWNFPSTPQWKRVAPFWNNDNDI
jgi:prepilin-type processing-associated H-X9-DG protein